MLRPPRDVPDWAVLSLVCLAQFMVILDVSVVTVALPAIARDLDMSSAGLQWVLNAYAIAFAGFLLLGGRAADLYGRKRAFVTGLSVFTAASLVGGFAATGAMLLGARVVQGLGAAILSPATLTILTTTFPEGPRRHRAIGVWSALAGVGGAAGVLLGGVLTDAAGWRWILFINVPFGVVGVIAALVLLADSRVETAERALDIIGAVLVTAGLMIGVYGLVSTATHGWTSSLVVGSLVASVVLLIAFVVNERRFARAPLVPLDIFRMRAVSVANVVMFLLGGAVFASWFFLSLYMQFVLGYSPLKTGLAFIPNSLTLIVSAQISSRLITRIGARPLLVVGPLLCATGLFLMAAIPVDGTFVHAILIPSCMVTTGLGLTFTPIAVSATTGVPPHRAGLASGLINTTRQVGGAVGLAVLATIAEHRAASVASTVGDTAARVAGYDRAFVVAGFFAIAASVAALFIPRTPVTATAPEPGMPVPAEA